METTASAVPPVIPPVSLSQGSDFIPVEEGQFGVHLVTLHNQKGKASVAAARDSETDTLALLPGHSFKLGQYQQTRSTEINRVSLKKEKRPVWRTYNELLPEGDYSWDSIANHEYRLVLDPKTLTDKLGKMHDRASRQQRKLSEREQYYPCIHFGSVMQEFLSNGQVPHGREISSITIDSGGLENTRQQSGFAISIGQKKEQQDVHAANSFTSLMGTGSQNYQFYGIFDGHGATFTSSAVVSNLPASLQQRLQQYGSCMPQDIAEWNALKISFVDTNHRVKNMARADDVSGSTACVALIGNNTITLANLGDSRALIADDQNKVTQLSEDAKAGDPDYQRSIGKRWGVIASNDRIAGVLATARAFGDKGLSGISARPKITRTSFSKGDVLVIASDGIFDYATSDQVGKLASELRRQGKKPQDIAHTIVELTLSANHLYNMQLRAYGKTATADNMSVIVVFPDEPSS